MCVGYIYISHLVVLSHACIMALGFIQTHNLMGKLLMLNIRQKMQSNTFYFISALLIGGGLYGLHTPLPKDTCSCCKLLLQVSLL